jgi:hypothetical protein
MAYLLRESISRCGIWCAVGGSLTWLLHGMIERCAACPDPVHAQRPRVPMDVVLQRLEADADARWRFGAP